MLNFVRQGTGRPLLLIHGLGGSWQSWATILPALGRSRDVIALDLPGHGDSPAIAGSDTFSGLADSVSAFISDQRLDGVDIVGSSLGARIALEMARRGKVGTTIALAPSGFWQGWERTVFRVALLASVRIVRGLRLVVPVLSRITLTRTLLLAPLSVHPWKLDGQIVATLLESYATTPTFDALVRDLASAPEQEGPAADTSGPIVLGWGRQDRLCWPRHAARAMQAFPSARLHWFEKCGHLPMWDQPAATEQLILSATGEAAD